LFLLYKDTTWFKLGKRLLFLFLKNFNIVFFESGPLILMVAVADLPLGVDKAKYVSWLVID
jgi:hypothetical protein